MRKALLAALLFANVLFSHSVLAGPWINYTDSSTPGDILITDILVGATGNTTYYESLGWNQGQDGGGYTGIQDHPTYGKMLIYSLWTPSTGGTISSVYAEPGALVKAFGGEGVGMHILTRPDMGGTGWELNTWYTTVTRVWDYAGASYYGLWFKNQFTGIWSHIATWSFPQAGQRFKCCTAAFLENWSGGDLGATRRNYTKNIWKRYGTTGWHAFNEARFVPNTTGGALPDDTFYMETGPTSVPNITVENKFQTINAPAQGAVPSLTPGEITSSSVTYTAGSKSIETTWQISQTKGPQYSYLIEVFDNPSYTGSPKLSFNDIAPHIRNVTKSVSSLKRNKTYYVRLRIADILDQVSNYSTSSFYKNN